MNKYVVASCISLCVSLGCNTLCGDQPVITAKDDFYKQGNARGLYYLTSLVDKSDHKVRELIVSEFVSRAFNYWLLLERKDLEKDVHMEITIKKMIDGKVISEDMLKDPLRRKQPAPRYAGPRGYMIGKTDYEQLVERFIKFVNQIEHDGAPQGEVDPKVRPPVSGFGSRIETFCSVS